MSEHRKNLLLFLAWLALLGLSVLWRLKNIDAFGLNNDEGAYLMWARLAAEGYPLYSATRTGSPPLFIGLLAQVFSVLGFSVTLGRLFVLTWYVALAGVLGYFSKQIAGWVGAYAALIIIAMITPLFALSRQVMLEIPAMTLAAASVGAVFGYFRINVTADPFDKLRAGRRPIRQAQGRPPTADRRPPTAGKTPLVTTLQRGNAYRDALRRLARGKGGVSLPFVGLVLGGVFLALSLLVKFLYPLAMAPILYLIWYASNAMRRRFKDAVVFGLVFALTFVLAVSLFDVGGFIDQAILFRSETRVAEPLQFQTNWEGFAALSSSLWGLSLLVVAGIVVILASPSFFSQRGENQPTSLPLGGIEGGRAWILWFALTFVLLMWYRPIFPHHYTILLPPAILLANEFIAFCRRKPRFYWGWAIVSIAMLNIPGLISANQRIINITTGGREAEAASIFNQVTRPADFVISDSQLLAHYADRMTPPPLADISLVYIQSGRQTPASLIEMSQDYAVTAVAPWAFRLDWLPEYLDWAAENFWIHKVWDNQHSIYFGPKHPAGQPVPNAQTMQFEENITFSGYSVDSDIIQPGSNLYLTLYWQATGPLEIDYTIFVQALNESGALFAQNDSQPIYGYFPTTAWPVNEIIPDRVSLDLPADLAPGSYTIVTGLYDLNTLERVKLSGSQQDFIAVTTVQIK